MDMTEFAFVVKRRDDMGTGHGSSDDGGIFGGDGLI
jgi:hypothetical protein